MPVFAFELEYRQTSLQALNFDFNLCVGGYIETKNLFGSASPCKCQIILTLKRGIERCLSGKRHQTKNTFGKEVLINARKREI